MGRAFGPFGVRGRDRGCEGLGWCRGAVRERYVRGSGTRQVRFVGRWLRGEAGLGEAGGNGFLEGFGEGLGLAGLGGDGTVGRVVYDVGDGVGAGRVADVGRQVGGGDLQAVEEEAGAFGVEAAGGEAVQDQPDGGLDGAAIVDQGHVEEGECVAQLAGFGRAGGVVVVAEGLVAEAFAAAAVAVGEDVAALEGSGFGHDSGLLPPGIESM